MGLTTDLTPAMTQGSGIAGYGITSENISPLNLIYRRKIGYGVRSTAHLTDFSPANSACADGALRADEQFDVLRRVLREALASLQQPH